MDGTPPPAVVRPSRPLVTWQRTAFVAGLLLLVLWGVWWARAVRQNRLVSAQHTWVPAWPFLGLDFLNNYLAARHWRAGGEPYTQPFGDPNGRALCYPPVMLEVFGWSKWVAPRQAVVIWTAALACFAAAGAFAAWRSRKQLGLWDVPLPLALAGVLLSSPVLYAMERGNYDLLVVPPLILAAVAFRRRSVLRDAVGGSALAFAAVIKIYPGLLVLSLIPLRRYRALACCAVAGVALAAVHYEYLPQFRINAQQLVAQDTPANTGNFSTTTHTLSGCWALLWTGTRAAPLARVPGLVAALVLVLPGVGWASYRVYRCAEPARVVYPYLLWLAAAASFLPPVANDYSLVFLPVAAVALWDRRDPVVVHLGMALLLVALQPVAFGISVKALLLAKFVGLLAVGGSLMVRAREQAAVVAPPAEPEVRPTTPLPVAA